MIRIGENLNVMVKKIGAAMKERDPKPIQELAIAEAKAGVDYIGYQSGAGPQRGRRIDGMGRQNGSGGGRYPSTSIPSTPGPLRRGSRPIRIAKARPSSIPSWPDLKAWNRNCRWPGSITRASLRSSGDLPDCPGMQTSGAFWLPS